nr:O-antigen ligase family protein [Allobranchiibius sp. GilTou38]
MNRTYRVWASIVAVLVATVLVDAASRGPALGAVIAIIAGVAFSARAGRSAQRTFAAVTAVVAAAYLLIKQSTTPRRLTDFNDTSTQARQVLWGRTARLITDHPLGVGWGKLWDAIPSNEALSSGYTQYPHNLFLEAGSEAGWLALVMVVVLVITTVRLQRQRATGWVEVAMFCLLLFHLVNAQVSGDITANRGLWVAFGAALAASAGDSKLRDGRVRRAYGHLRQGKRPIEIRA